MSWKKHWPINYSGKRPSFRSSFFYYITSAHFLNSMQIFYTLESPQKCAHLQIAQFWMQVLLPIWGRVWTPIMSWLCQIIGELVPIFFFFSCPILEGHLVMAQTCSPRIPPSSNRLLSRIRPGTLIPCPLWLPRSDRGRGRWRRCKLSTADAMSLMAKANTLT